MVRKVNVAFVFEEMTETRVTPSKWPNGKSGVATGVSSLCAAQQRGALLCLHREASETEAVCAAFAQEENYVSDFNTTTDTRTANQGAHTGGNRVHTPARRVSSETKASFKTSELVAYVVVAILVLVAAAMTDVSDFGAQESWFYVTLLTIGYMISRGLAKSGSRDFYDDDADHNHNR